MSFASQIGRDHIGMVANFGRSSFSYFLSMIEYSNSVADTHGDLHVVLN